MEFVNVCASKGISKLRRMARSFTAHYADNSCLCGEYLFLERTQKQNMDVTPWMEWFLGYLGRAIEGAQHTLAAVLTKARFWQGIADVTLNDRQRLLNRLLDGFEGKLTTSRWAKLTKSSQDTALRDILPLVEQGILARNPEGGRTTNYALGSTLQAPITWIKSAE
jgi:Fic family protein